MRDLFDGYGNVSRNVGLRVLPVVDFEAQMVLAVPGSVFHGDHARVLVELEPRMLGTLPIELLVRQVPVVQVVDVHAADFRFRGLSLVVVHEDLFAARLHLVVVHVADDDGQCAGAGHGWVSVVFYDNWYQILFLLLAVEGPQRRHDCHSVAVCTLCNSIRIFNGSGRCRRSGSGRN